MMISDFLVNIATSFWLIPNPPPSSRNPSLDCSCPFPHHCPILSPGCSCSKQHTVQAPVTMRLKLL